MTEKRIRLPAAVAEGAEFQKPGVRDGGRYETHSVPSNDGGVVTFSKTMWKPRPEGTA